MAVHFRLATDDAPLCLAARVWAYPKTKQILCGWFLLRFDEIARLQFGLWHIGDKLFEVFKAAGHRTTIGPIQ